MKLIQSMNEIDKISGEVGISLGTFDGLHVGHRKLIDNLIVNCKKRNLKSVVYTFSNHPREYTLGLRIPKIISLDEKIHIFSSMGIDYLILLKFDNFQRDIDADYFIKDFICKKLNVKFITVGFDYRFGKNANGDGNLFKKYSSEVGYEIDIVESVNYNEEKISSTLIRNMLYDGEIEKANLLLGRNYSFSGEVIHGKKLGRKLGFPTANIYVNENMNLIKSGVYLSRIKIGKKYHNALTNVGFNPTFDRSELSVESYIINYSDNLYGRHIRVEFLKMLRDEKKFSSKEELIEQMKNDLIKAEKYFNGN